MAIEAKRQVHSRLILNYQPLIPEEQRFVQVSRDDLINKAIKGSLGIPPTGEITIPEVFSFNDENYLRTEVSEVLDSEKSTVMIDTRYVPVSAGPEKYYLEPEVSVIAKSSGEFGDVTNVDTIRGFPSGTGRAVVETIHRLMVGVLIDGGTGEDVVSVYDKALAELNEGSSSKDLIWAFRENSLRGGKLSYLRFRYSNSIDSRG